MVAGGVVAAGGGAVEEGDEELAHGGDAGGDYDYELFGPERGEGGVSGVVVRRGRWGGEGTHIIQMTRSTVSTTGG